MAGATGPLAGAGGASVFGIPPSSGAAGRDGLVGAEPAGGGSVGFPAGAGGACPCALIASWENWPGLTGRAAANK